MTSLSGKRRKLFGFLLLLLALSYSFLQLSRSRHYQLWGRLVWRLPTEEKLVALTFDDGPTAYTDSVLELLKEKDVKATFFLLGRDMAKHPEVTRRIVEAGHQLGNHSYTHRRMVGKSQAFIHSELQRTDRLIRESGYRGEIVFRPPHGKKLFALPWYLEKHDILTVMWDVEPDSHESEVDSLVEHTLSKVRPGSIVLLHPHYRGNEVQRQALPQIIDGLKEEGYRFTTLSEAL